MKPGEIITDDGYIECNVNKNTVKITVINTGDRPIQVGSHFHFFEVNKALKFNRDKSFGMHLDIASGTAVRFEPGEEKEIVLTGIGGSREVYGLNNLTCGSVDSASIKAESMIKLREQNFKEVIDNEL